MGLDNRMIVGNRACSISSAHSPDHH